MVEPRPRRALGGSIDEARAKRRGAQHGLDPALDQPERAYPRAQRDGCEGPARNYRLAAIGAGRGFACPAPAPARYEKAQVEDKRAALAAESAKLGSVADAFIDCNGGLVDILRYALNADWASVNYYFPGVLSTCQGAQGELADYNATHGG
jgi:hypothetical protein